VGRIIINKKKKKKKKKSTYKIENTLKRFSNIEIH